MAELLRYFDFCFFLVIMEKKDYNGNSMAMSKQRIRKDEKDGKCRCNKNCKVCKYSIRFDCSDYLWEQMRAKGNAGLWR